MSDIIRIESDNALILLTHIGEESCYAEYMTSGDRDHLSRIGSGKRRAASAAWRAALRQELGRVEIGYNSVGAPVISGKGAGKHIGVSHSTEMAAVIISDRRCAIDVERTDRNFEKISARYISPEENSLSNNGDTLFKAALWCAKETLYKFSGRRELDLINDLRIVSADIDGQTLTGSIRSAEGWSEHGIKLFVHENHVITYMTE